MASLSEAERRARRDSRGVAAVVGPGEGGWGFLPAPLPRFPGAWRGGLSWIGGVVSARSPHALTGSSGLGTRRVPPTSCPEQKVEGRRSHRIVCPHSPGQPGCGTPAHLCTAAPVAAPLHFATAQATWRTSGTCDFLAVLGDTGSFPKAQVCFHPYKTTRRFSFYLEFCSIT